VAVGDSEALRENKTIRVNHLQHKCNPGTLASGDISFVRLFAGVPWRVVTNKNGVFHSEFSP